MFESELTTILDPLTIYMHSKHWMFNTYLQKGDFLTATVYIWSSHNPIKDISFRFCRMYNQICHNSFCVIQLQYKKFNVKFC